jgi:hypothetical protein
MFAGFPGKEDGALWERARQLDEERDGGCRERDGGGWEMGRRVVDKMSRLRACGERNEQRALILVPATPAYAATGSK